MLRCGLVCLLLLGVMHAQFDDMEERHARALELTCGMQSIKQFVPILSHSNNLLLSDAIYHDKAVFNPTAIKDGDIVYVVPSLFTHFMKEALPQINAKIVILSHIRYCPKTKRVEGSDPNHDWYQDMLDDSRIVAWFGMNMNINHPKAHPLPLGCCWYKPQQYYKPTALLKTLAQAQYFKNKIYHCYVNYRARDSYRTLLFEDLSRLERRSMFHFSRPKSFGKYYSDLQHSEFVLSPRGVNPDCYRTWEALYAGSIPIVERTGIEQLYEDLPVIIVDSFKNLTRELLQKAKAELATKTFNLRKLHSQYWIDQILEKQREARNH